MTSPSPPKAAQDEARRKRTVAWVVGLATLGLIFDGYDLVVYGTVVSTFLRHPDEIGAVTPAAAGALGSYALVGVLVGALLAGALGDIVGRRKVMLAGYAWFAVFMIFTALATNTTIFGLGRFLTGIGVGALVGTTGALVAEFAPPGEEEPLQRHHLLRCPVRQLARRAAGHPAAGIDRLARAVLDRRASSGDPAPARLLQDAGVGRLARQPRPHR